MTHLVALVACLAGFATLACATRRQQRDIFGRSLRAGTTNSFRAVGAGMLLLALAALVTNHGWSLGLVMFSGHTSLAAGIVFICLCVRLRIKASTQNS